MRIADVQRFCMHDGPGIRTTIFLKGCPLRCIWCHNPETQSKSAEILYYEKKCIGCSSCSACNSKAHVFTQGHLFQRENCIACGYCAQVCPTNALELCGEDKTVEAVLETLQKDMAFYGEKGGVTVSGGEPLSQGEAVKELLIACKERGISTVIETCGYGDREQVQEWIPWCDLFLWDIKDTDAQRHLKNTGVSNESILSNLFAVDALGGKTRLRCILVGGINTDMQHYAALVDIAKKLKNCEGIEFLPYHAYGGAKRVAIGKENNGNDDWVPTKEQILEAKAYVKQQGIKVFNEG